MPSTFADLICPSEPAHFVSHVLGKEMLHQRNGERWFAALMSWDTVNQIIDLATLDGGGRIRMAKDGSVVPSPRFLQTATPPGRSGSILQKEMIQLLTEGATLVIDSVHELHPPLKTLTEQMEVVLMEPVRANMYMGWGTTKGFDLHWDQHDVFVLQVAGRKAWKVYGASRQSPVPQDRQINFPAPEAPIWEETLCDGDLLYLPRGWWHVATALAEPTLHITLGVKNRTGLDLIAWLANQLPSEDVFRRDIPRFATIQQQDSYLDEIRRALIDILRPGLISAYLTEIDNRAEAIRKLSLPWHGTREQLPSTEHFLIRLLVRRKPRLTVDNNAGTVSLIIEGKSYTFSIMATAVLEMLGAGEWISFKELHNRASGSFSKEVLRSLLQKLSMTGLLAFRDL